MSQHKSSRRRSQSSRSNSLSPVVFLAVLVGAILILGGAITLTNGGSAAASASRSGSAVSFTVNDFDGKPVHSSDYRGHPVLVNLWASWCPPCRAEMPYLIQFYRDHQAEGLVFLPVNSTDTLAPARQFALQQGMDFPVLFDPDGRLMRMFGSQGLPASYLLDRNGNVVYSVVGGMTPDVLKKQVAPLISQ